MATRQDQQAPLRIALVITELEVGGAERCLVNLATGLDADTFAPVVYSLGPRPTGDRDPLVRQLDDAGIRVEFLDATSPYQFPSAVRRLRTLLRTQQPDVVQTFLFHANVVGTIAARREKMPAVSIGIRVAESRKMRQRIERQIAKRADRVVCVSQSVAEQATKSLRLRGDKIEVIPNGVDIANFPAKARADLAKFAVPADQKVITAIGRLEKQKGFDWLLQLSPRMFDRLPDHHLLIVGDGEQRETLQRLVKSLQLVARVHFTGWQPNPAELMRASTMLVMPSRWEGMSNVLLEAMASSLPVVATDVEGVREVIGDAEEQVVGVSNPNEFVERVVAIATNAEMAEKLGVFNRNRIADHFSLSAMIEKYARLFRALGHV